MGNDDPLSLLGLSPGATEQQIQAAYRAKARACHPDLHPGDPTAADEFRRINEAYTALRDNGWQPPPAGSANFDFKFGGEPTPSSWGVQSVVDNMFGGASSPPGRAARPRTNTQPPRGTAGGAPFADPNQETGTVRVPFEAAVLGGDHQLDVRHDDGGLPRRVHVSLPPGVTEGDKLRIEGRVVTARIQPHTWFKRDGHHVLVDVPLTLAELVFGALVRVPTLTGGVEIRVPPGARPGQKLRLRGKGVTGVGDQLCVLAVAMPDLARPGVHEAVMALDRVEPNSPRPWDEAGASSRAGKLN